VTHTNTNAIRIHATNAGNVPHAINITVADWSDIVKLADDNPGDVFLFVRGRFSRRSSIINYDVWPI